MAPYVEGSVGGPAQRASGLCRPLSGRGGPCGRITSWQLTMSAGTFFPQPFQNELYFAKFIVGLSAQCSNGATITVSSGPAPLPRLLCSRDSQLY
jgi:hypothetical protein